MNLYFEYEVSELAGHLKDADNYLEGEAIGVVNIKKQVDKYNSIIAMPYCYTWIKTTD